MTQTNPRLASLPIEQIDVSQPHLFQSNEVLDYFRRLRNEAPVHYCAESATGRIGPLHVSKTSCLSTHSPINIPRSSVEFKLSN